MENFILYKKYYFASYYLLSVTEEMFVWNFLCFSSLIYANNEHHYAKAARENDDGTPKDCPTWYLPAENDTSKCVCGNTLNGNLKCLEREEIGILFDMCITYMDEQALVGVCPYLPSGGNVQANIYTTVPKNISDQLW